MTALRSKAEGAMERLRREIARPDESLLDALDRLAATELGRSRPDQLLWPHLDDIVRLRTDGHPWARLLVAATLVGIVSRGAPVEVPPDSPDVDKLLGSAVKSFRRGRDRAGMGMASLVRGGRAFGQGRLSEAIRHWNRARELLGDGMPAQELTLAHLALEAYQRGDLSAAESHAEKAAAFARIAENPEAEAVAEIYRTMFAFYRGAFSLCEDALARAEAAFERVPPGSQQVERPLVDAARGVLFALRQEYDAAEQAFAKALRIAERNGIPWFEAVTRALRAEFTAVVDPARSLEDGKRSTEAFSSVGDEWWWNWAVRAQAVAARHTMNLDASQELLLRVLARDQNAIERGRTLLELGLSMLAAGDRAGAAGWLDEAHAELNSSGADYWLARTLVAQAAAHPAGGAQLRERAYSLAPEPDPAWVALVSAGSLEIRVLGESVVAVDGKQVAFRSRHAEHAVYALAVAGERGLESGALVERLWPGSTPETSARRLRSAIWAARKALGSEGWRLHRRKDRWVLEEIGARINLAEVRAVAEAALAGSDREAAREAIEALSSPLLPAWAYEDWVQEEARAVGELVAALQTLCASSVDR